MSLVRRLCQWHEAAEPEEVLKETRSETYLIPCLRDLIPCYRP